MLSRFSHGATLTPKRSGAWRQRSSETFETEETLWETFAHRAGGASTVEEVRLVDHLKSSQESSALLGDRFVTFRREGS